MQNGIITENQLDEWVRANTRVAQGVIVEMVWRLVAASSPRPRQRRFPLGDSIGQAGPDGELDVTSSFDPFVPEGRSFWEIGTGLDAKTKATSDYRDSVANIPDEIRRNSTFVFVTPLSGRRDWPDTWKEGSQASWLGERHTRNEWRDVRVIDGTKIIDWLHQFPSVNLWLAQKMDLPIQQIDTPEQHWNILKTIGVPLLTPQVFLTNRDIACAKLNEIFSGATTQLKLASRYPDQISSFVSAYIANMDEDSKIDALGRCLIVSGGDALHYMMTLHEPHVLIADFDLDREGALSQKLLEKVHRAGHTVIYGGLPGGIPHLNSAPIPNPRVYQLKESLQKSGYGEERARILAQKSGGNLSSLLRCLQNLPVMPEWAEGKYATELAIAALLGAWDEKKEADRIVVESISKNSYDEWIGKIREVALRPGTPLTQHGGLWKFNSRYEGWYELCPRIFDDYLSRLRKVAIEVFHEQDPRFSLPIEKRYIASIYGKDFLHSHALRQGLAECLALLGNHPRALTACTFSNAEATAIFVIREVLNSANWVQWASINDLLPMLAEAAPSEFLNAVEKALNSDPCPFEELFTQESSGISGTNYLTGLLWALETLAWDTDYLSRVVMILGEVAARDPGGKSANRPSNSLTNILLPWLPQTCAPVARRKAVVEMLLNEYPDVAWKLLLSLLPNAHETSSGTRKPTWRETIPDEWIKGVTHSEYWEQINAFSDIAICAAKGDLLRLGELIERLDEFPNIAYEQLLAYLSSNAILSMTEADRFVVWTKFDEVVSKHRKFPDAAWAMKPGQIDRISAVAERFAPNVPALRHRRLFRERDFYLFEGKGTYEEQQRELAERRTKAVEDIAASGGAPAVLAFAESVEVPWRVGMSYGFAATDDADIQILPILIDSNQTARYQFVGGYITSRFRNRGWVWVDSINITQWPPAQVGQFLSFLPFTPDTWAYSAKCLSEDESPYWTRTSANPYDTETSLDIAVDQLIEYGRPYSAINCLYRTFQNKQAHNTSLAIRALLSALVTTESIHSIDGYNILEIIDVLQDDPNANLDEVMQVEWAYLPIMERHQKTYPKLLEHRLAVNPRFFCDVIRLAFRAKNENEINEAPTEQARYQAENAYRLLRGWKTPPGCREDGTYDDTALIQWLDAVKADCKATGHIEIAMTMVGHVLIYIPADPNDLWIHRSAAAVLNAKDAIDIREGFLSAVFNSRDAHWVDPTGKPELEFAQKYRLQADQAENTGYHRLAAMMRSLAESYDEMADRIILEHNEDDT